MTSTLDLKTWIRRRWRRLLLTAIVLLLLGVLAQAMIGSMIRARMASMLAATWGIELHTSSAWYLPPRGISLHGVRLTKLRTDGSQVELFRASRVVLTGAHLPKAGQPLIVDGMEINSPVVTVENHPDVMPPAAWAVVALPVLATSAKFELHNLKITNGRYSYDGGGEPLVLDPVNLTITPSAGSKRLYNLSLTADQASSNQIQGSGLIDMNDLVLGFSELSLRVNASVILAHLPLSDSLRRKLAGCQVGGTIDLHGKASIPLHDLRHASYQADIHLEAGKAVMPGSQILVERAGADIHMQDSSGAAGMQITVRNLAAASGGTLFSVDNAKFQTAADGQSWELSGVRGRMDVNGGVPAFDRIRLRGVFVFTATASGAVQFPKDASAFMAVRHEMLIYPRDASVQPPRFPVAVEHICGGPISFRGGVVRFANVRGDYGGDQVLLDDARVTIDDPRQRVHVGDFRRQIRIEGIAGTLICHQPGPLYPAALGITLLQLRPTGPFVVGGGSWYAINRKLPGENAIPRPDFFFHVSSVKGAFALTNHQVPLTSIRGEAVVSPMMVDIISLRGDFLGGTVIAKGKVTPARPIYYEGLLTFYNVNLETARNQLGLRIKNPVVGQMYLQSHVSGIGRGGGLTPVEAFAAEGEFDVVDGNFGDIAAIRAAAQNVTKPDQPLDGNADGAFAIRNNTVTLQNCAVGNPLFGLQGSGAIGFDKKLDLHVVAAPLGDWHTAMKHSKVPVLEDTGSNIAAAIQGLFNGAQRVLLWDIHICGTAAAPVVKVAPAPVITEPLAALFAGMIRGDKHQHVIEDAPTTKPDSAGAEK